MPPVVLLLFPEDSATLRATEYPRAIYARVTRRSPAGATVQPLDAPDIPSFTVADALVQLRSVPELETRTGSPGTLMRQPVMCEHNGVLLYGQVVAYTQRVFTVRTSSDRFDVPHASVTEVAPACVFLLHRSQRATADVVGDVNDRHNLILDRLLGQNGMRATKSIAKLLGGICDRTSQPGENDILTWTHPTTGAALQVSVRHVVNYGYYRDGGKRVPVSLVDALGETVFDDPTVGRQPDANRSAPDVNQDSFDEYLAAMDVEEEEETRHVRDDAPRPPTQVPAMDDDRTHTDRGDLVLNAQIMAALADSPVLLRYYLDQQVQLSKRKRPIDDSELGPRKLPRLAAASDFVTNEIYTDKTRTKETFRPSSSSRLIHVSITAEDHKGKDPVEFIELCMSSPATKFRPHPGVLLRLFDFQFGLRGLSIWHFMRFDLQARREWIRSGKVNMANFAASVDAPAPSGDKTIQGLSDGLALLAVYAEEFFDRTTRRLIVDAKEFCEELRSHTSWEPADVDTLGYWFDSVFEAYRRAVNNDLSSGANTRSLVRQKLSMHDSGLQGILYVIQSERLAALGSQRRQEPGHQRRDHRQDAPPRAAKIPKEVLDALPRQGGKSICLKFLSRQGCSSKSKDKCVVPNRAHVVPVVIPNVVVKYLEEHLGGARTEATTQ